EELEEIAESSSTKIEIISVETREGIQLRELSGIAAILRYPVHRE
ncbi:MAG: mRNA surveillance protein Pelota, partial [Nanoarchaeota archaeon]|nr:mRNA surveillance protein Pelota [Nanoarchaeota archaeon]